MKRMYRIVLVLASTLAIALGIVAVSPREQAFASITPKVPIVQTTTAVACVSFQCNWGSGTDIQGAQCVITYAPVDDNGNFIPGQSSQTSGILSGAALNAFVSTPGNARVRCQASLQAQVGALAGDAS